MTFPEKTSLRPSMHFMLVFVALIGFDMLASPLVSVKALGNAGYFAPLVAVAPFFAVIAVIFVLQKKFPGKSVLQYSSQIIGRVPAVIVNLLVIIFWRFYTTLVALDILTLVSTQMLLKTPLWFFSLVGFFGIVYLAYQGIESVSRFVAFVFLPATIVIILVFFSAFPYINTSQLLPVFNFGVKDLAKGALNLSYIYFPILLLFVITPFTRDLRSGRRFAMGAVALSAFGFLIQHISAIGIFGTAGLARYTWPTLEFVHVVNIRYLVLEQLGVILLTVWLVMTFGAAAFSYWGSSYALSQLFPKISYKAAVLILALPTGLILLLPRNIIDIRFYLSFLQQWGALPLICYPLVLWLIAVVRCRGKGSKVRAKN